MKQPAPSLPSISILCYQLSIIFLLFLMVAAPTQAANHTALVIGNSHYASSPLANPVNDATDISRVLKQLGFSVILKIDASKRDMVDALRDFGRQLTRSDIGLFYFAGHGMQINGVNYLIPVKTNIREEVEVEFEAFDANRILAAMERAGNKLNIVILDACRDNPFNRSFRTAQNGLAQMDAPLGTVIAYATSPGSVAEDGRGRNGTYTEALLKNFQTPGLDVQKMFNQTGLDVMEKTSRKQVPWVSTSPFPDFFLAGGNPEDLNLKPAAPTVMDPVQNAKPSSRTCGANIAPGVWKEFDCYNLAAIGKTTGEDPFTPSWRLIGGYWQWGRKGPDASEWYDSNTKNFAHGPTGPDSGDANSGQISGWDSSGTPNGAWSDASKTANIPCPAGFRVPTKTQWDGVIENNTLSTVGTWSSSSTNYSSVRFFGDKLLLPAAGDRSYSSGFLEYRGYYGCYWSSSENGSNNACHLYFNRGSAYTNFYNRRAGHTIRCVAE